MTDKTKRHLMRLIGVALLFMVSILIGVAAGNSLSGAIYVVISVLGFLITIIIGGLVIAGILHLILYGRLHD